MIKVCTASAGAGKTHKLAGEYIGLLFKQPKAYRHILAVTFTNKATDEMKQRILQELYILSTPDGKSDYMDNLVISTSLSEEKIREQAKSILVSILHDYSAFSITTIDRFFQMVMRSFAKELGRMATYEVELDVEAVLSASIDRMFADLEDPNNNDLLHWLIDFSLEEVDNGETWDIKKKISRLSKEVFSENFKLIRKKCKVELTTLEVGELKKYLTTLVSEKEENIRNLVKRGISVITEFGLDCTSFKNGARSPFTYFKKAMALRKGILVPTSSFAKLYDNFDNWSTKSNEGMILAVYPKLNPIVGQICEFFDKDGEYSEWATAKAILSNVNLLGILSHVYSRILDYCREKNVILISESTELLNRIIDGSDTPFIYEKIGTTINNYMLDEFQDTSTMQWNNFYPLISNSLDGGNYNLIVGDVKQSIYRWRGSDWDILDKKLKEQFRADQIIDDPIDTNWRSGKEIIEFNNNFFAFCADEVKLKYANEDAADITNIYSKLEQKLPKKRSGAKAYVKVKFLPKTENGYESDALVQLEQTIKELLERGYSLSDIAVLVRKNSEGASIASYLIERGFDVISGDSLYISSSNAVLSVINVLREMDNPNQGILEIYKKYMSIPSVSNQKGDSLYQLCESIIRETLQDEQKEDIAFLQAFLDLVLAYTLKEGTNISEFLKWWDETGVNKTISAPEDIDAVKIMTIHKSKGLAFNVTIIPFLKETLGHGAFTAPILWNEFEYNSNDGKKKVAVPVKYSSQLEPTLFASNYYREKLCSYVDAINTAYVAFTRAKKELFVFAQQPELKKDGDYTIKSISDILYKYCEKNLVELSYESGIPFKVEKIEAPVEKFDVKGAFMCAKHTDVMKSALGSGSIGDGETIREYGIAMHYVFSLITDWCGVENAVKQAVEYGAADCTYDKLLNLVNSAMDYVKEYDWFNPKYKVYNECAIINTDGSIKRPDRIITEGNSAIVIDYKFGTYNDDSLQLEKYKRQVKNYKSLLTGMNFKNVKGYLWYPLDNKVIEI